VWFNAENPSVRLMLRTRLLCSINRAQENCSVDLQKKQQILVSKLCLQCLSSDVETKLFTSCFEQFRDM